MKSINSDFKNLYKLTCAFAVAVLTLIGVQTLALASEDATGETLPSIDWGPSNPYSLISNPSEATTQVSTDRQEMYRLYNKYTGEHHYTSSASERDNVIAAGWNDEGTGWYAPSTSSTPVYRVYNSICSGGEHHYTMSEDEVKMLVEEGWTDEGIGWYSIDETEKDKTPVYRQYNPNQFSCNHNYTINESEKNNLISLGWRDERIGWYGYADAGSDAKTQALDFSKITVSTTAKTYNGKAQTQTVTSSAYKLNTDYTVTYSNNKNAGTATIVVKGKGSYTGSKTYTFKINKLDISNATVTVGRSLTYNGNEQTQTVSTVTASGIALGSSDFDVSNNTATDAGDYTLKVTGKGNFTGTATKAFSIAKAKPVCVAPTGLTGYVGDKLSAVDIASETVTGNTPGTFTWAVGTQTMSEAGDKEFAATFTPSVTKNYEIVQNIAVKVKVVKYVTVTFNATAPGSEMITMDGTSQNKVEKKLAYDDSVAATPVHTFVTADFPTVTIASTNTDGYVFAGWATTSGATAGKKVYEMLGTTVSADTQYYAVWSNAKGFWLGTKGANEDYTDEAYFATNDTNYHSGAEIVSDMDVLHNSNDSNYTAVKAKWDKYYTDDNVRLYATYNGGENETAADKTTTSPLNKYVEFRILEVSGADGHKLSNETTSDGSAVSFMATHVLPTCYQMKTENKNEGGWGASQLYKDMNKVSGTEGKIYSKFSADFVSQVKAVTKEYNKGRSGSSQTATPSTVDCQFWILSYSELVKKDAAGYASWAPKLEGTQYTWCATVVVNGRYGSSSLVYTTRGGDSPGSEYPDELSNWWERSPNLESEDKFLEVRETNIAYHMPANWYYGVVPCFCF